MPSRVLGVLLVPFIFDTFAVRDAARVDVEEEVGEGNCEYIDDRQGWQCHSVKRLTGGYQGNTYVVSLSADGAPPFEAVLKEANNEKGDRYQDAFEAIQNEINVARYLSDRGFTKMPQYYFDVGLNQRYAEHHAILAMEFLDGWGTLSALASESPRDREIRAAALFTAYEELRLAKVSHCDFNSGNAMFKLDDPCQAKIIDFGLARVGESIVGSCSGKLPDLWDGAGRPGYLWRALYMGYKDIDSADFDSQYLVPARGHAGVPLATSARNDFSFLSLPFNNGMGMNAWKSGQGRRHAKQNWALILRHAKGLLQRCGQTDPNPNPANHHAVTTRPVTFEPPVRPAVQPRLTALDAHANHATDTRPVGIDFPQRPPASQPLAKMHQPEAVPVDPQPVNSPSEATAGQWHRVKNYEDARQKIERGATVKYVVNRKVEFEGVLTHARASRREMRFGNEDRDFKIAMTKFDHPQTLPELFYAD